MQTESDKFWAEEAAAQRETASRQTRYKPTTWEEVLRPSREAADEAERVRKEAARNMPISARMAETLPPSDPARRAWVLWSVNHELPADNDYEMTDQGLVRKPRKGQS